MEELLGETIVRIGVKDDDDDYILFETQTGKLFKMHHPQDCCEHVYIESIVGDLDDILFSPVTLAEEVSNSDPDSAESATWTFYKIGTVKATVTIRWHGMSNGYYSEDVYFTHINPPDEEDETVISDEMGQLDKTYGKGYEELLVDELKEI